MDLAFCTFRFTPMKHKIYNNSFSICCGKGTSSLGCSFQCSHGITLLFYALFICCDETGGDLSCLFLCQRNYLPFQPYLETFSWHHPIVLRFIHLLWWNWWWFVLFISLPEELFTFPTIFGNIFFQLKWNIFLKRLQWRRIKQYDIWMRFCRRFDFFLHFLNLSILQITVIESSSHLNTN